MNHTTELIQLAGTITKCETMMDGTLRIRVDTQELSPEDSASLFSMYNKLGYFVFKPERLTESDIPTEKLEDAESKSPSQRLRAVLFVTHSQMKTTLSFDEFYRQQLEKIINAYKERLT